MYAALILDGNEKKARPKIVLFENGKDLEQKYFKYYKNMIVYRVQDEQSYGNYWQPIQEHIPKNATIYFSPDGVFDQINLETIPVSQDKYIFDQENIILVSNTKDLCFRGQGGAKHASENRALMFGDPEFYVSTNDVQAEKEYINPLPGTKSEVISLNELLGDYGWKTDFYLEANASEDRVKMLDNPKVFHIATHGFYIPAVEKSGFNLKMDGTELASNPLFRSGLLLTGAGDVLAETSNNFNVKNGILTAYEALSLNWDYTDLVVLSACETGVGDIKSGEGVYGLQRAFLVAGAKNLIMSLFKVSDKVTNELMVEFYKNWLDGNSLRQSFNQAKKEIRVKYPDPVFWGAFIMYGLE